MSNLAQKPNLSEMEDWARNPSDENWRQLLNVLTDMYVSSMGSGAAEHGDAYSDVACRLLDQVATDVRAELSTRISEIEEFPDQVVLRLAHDEEDEVASPVLEKSPVLDQKELMSIVSKMIPARSLAISKRSSVDKKMSEVLVSIGDPEILRAIAANPGAEFSDKTYRKVAEKAKSDEALRENVIDRADLTPAIKIQIMPFLSEELKERLRALDATPSGSLLDSLSEVTNEEAKKPISRSERASATVAVEQIQSGASRVDETVLKMASGGQSNTLCLLIAALAELPEEEVLTAFAEASGTKLSILCKALGVSNATFGEVAQLRATRVGVSDSVSERYASAYTKRVRAEALEALKAMQS